MSLLVIFYFIGATLNWNGYQGISIQYQIWTIESDGIGQMIDSVDPAVSPYRYLKSREGQLQYYISAITAESLACLMEILPQSVRCLLF